MAWTQGVARLGNAGFCLTCANAHLGLGAVSAIGFGGLASPFRYDGVNVWLDPGQPIFTLYLPGDPTGAILHPLPLPSDASYLGLTLFSQFLLLEPPGCMPLGLSGSNAIRVTVQS